MATWTYRNVARGIAVMTLLVALVAVTDEAATEGLEGIGTEPEPRFNIGRIGVYRA